VGLAGEVLDLHPAIREAVVVENRGGELHVADEATRNGNSALDLVNEREREILVAAPTVVLGAASQVGNVEEAGRIRLVGLLYEQRGSLFVPIKDGSYLMVTTGTEAFLEVVKTLQDRLPGLMQDRDVVSESSAIGSAIEADQTVRSFFATSRLGEPSSIRLENATLDTNKHSWQISGTYRAPHAVRTKHYYVELDSRNGAVTKFQVRT